MKRQNNNDFLVLFDLDGTLTETSSPWKYLLEKVNKWEQGNKNLEDFLKGKFDYQTFCYKDTALFKGLKVEDYQSYLDKINYRPNVSLLVDYLKKINSQIWIISAGFYYLAQKTALKWELDGFYANMIKSNNGKLNGDIEIQVTAFGQANKQHLAKQIKQKLNFSGTTISFGDTSGDLGLFEEADISFACFEATDVAIDKANYHITDFKDAITILKSILKNRSSK